MTMDAMINSGAASKVISTGNYGACRAAFIFKRMIVIPKRSEESVGY
jgi:hypothetical protein